MIRINYDFYKEYSENKKFLSIFELRKSYIRNKDNLNFSDEELVKERFVEIFSWTVLNKKLLLEH